MQSNSSTEGRGERAVDLMVKPRNSLVKRKADIVLRLLLSLSKSTKKPHRHPKKSMKKRSKRRTHNPMFIYLHLHVHLRLQPSRLESYRYLSS